MNRILVRVGMNNNQSTPFRIHANNNEPLFVVMLGIFHGERKLIKEQRNGISEINAVLAEVDLALAFIPLEIHEMNVCTLGILVNPAFVPLRLYSKIGVRKPKTVEVGLAIRRLLRSSIARFHRIVTP